MEFLKKNFSILSLLISFLFLIYTFYRAEIHWGGNEKLYYSSYYKISFFLIICSVISFFIKDNLKEYIIIILFSLIITIYVFEGYLTYKASYKMRMYEKETGKKYDTRYLLEIYSDLKKNDPNIVIKVTPDDHIQENNSLLPFSGISNSKTILGNENGYYIIYQSDRYGFRNPDEEWDKNEIEYLLVGDSMTHGCCVNSDIASILRKLSNRSVLNLGYGSNGPLLEFGVLREYYDKRAKKVLWIYFEGNDLHDLTDELKSNLLKNYLNDSSFSQNLKLRHGEINSLVKEKIELAEKIGGRGKNRDNFLFKLNSFIKIYNTRRAITKPGYSFEQPAPPIEFKEILKKAKDLVEENNSEIYFIYLPQYSRYQVGNIFFGKNHFNETNYTLVKNIVEELKIPFIDIHKEVFEKEKEPTDLFPFGLWGHYNPEGFNKIAKTIYKLTK